jgi:prophage tail gpP-like protein
MSNSKFNYSNTNKDEVVVTLNGKIFYGWQTNNLTFNMLEFADGFSFVFPYDVNVVKFVSPFAYEKVEISIGGQLVLTGNITKLTLPTTEIESMINIEGRSLVGLTLDSHIQPIKQYNNQQLSTIAKEIFNKYGVKLNFDKDVKINKSTIRAGETVYTFIKDFIIENSLLLYSLPDGSVFLTSVNISGSAKQTLQYGDGFTKSIETIFDGDKFFSSYKMQSQLQGKNYTSLINNSFVSIYRPYAPVKQAVINADLANKTEYHNSFGEAVKIVVTVVGWRKKDGTLWTKNEMVIIYSPQNYILKETKFLIEEVSFFIDADKQYSSLTCVMPEAYSVDDIKTVFWR